MFLPLFGSLALAAAPTVAPSDGGNATGSALPGWAPKASPVPVLADADSLIADLERAWQLRRELDNEAAGVLAARLVQELRPTLDTKDRDLLQRALFLQGLLALDAAGDLERLERSVPAGSLRIPPEWADAIAVSPGASAPASTDSAFAAHAYDEARTLLVAQQGVEVDLGTPGGDVRVDGETVTAPFRVLPGVHTLSVHPPGQPPAALLFRVGPGNSGTEIGTITAGLDALRAFAEGGAQPAPALRRELHARLGTPAALVRTEHHARTLWLVDGLARFGRPQPFAGVGLGGAVLAGGWQATPAGCGGSDAGTKGLVPLTAVAGVTLGPWRVTASAGVYYDVSDEGFATAEPVDCAGVALPGSITHPGFGALAVGYRVPLGGSAEAELALRGAGSPVMVAGEAVVTVPVVRPSPVGLALSAHAGAFANGWSGDGDRAGALAGLDAIVLFGRR